jgi:ATP-binding cassette subfamily B protein
VAAVALARAFMRPSALLVLDEPTAALDAEAEHEVFSASRSSRRGRTALLITHRFASVRDGRSHRGVRRRRGGEEGTHAALLGRDGLYAKMFRLQAKGYQEPTVS